MKFILGQKLDMAQIWKDDKVVPVTRVIAGPCRVAQIKTEAKDGYAAVQIGYGKKREKNINKPQLGHFRDLDNFRYVREFRLSKEEQKKTDALKRGDNIDVTTFSAGDKIRVIGVSKGRGFQGVVKRHNFSGAPASHGTKDQLRMPGSIGSTGPAHVFKGKRMSGRMGGDRVTTGELEIIGVEPENNTLLIKGSIPGARNGLVLIYGAGELKVTVPEEKSAEVAKVKQEKESLTSEKISKSSQQSVSEGVKVVKDENNKEEQPLAKPAQTEKKGEDVPEKKEAKDESDKEVKKLEK